MQFVKSSKYKDLIRKIETCKSPEELRKLTLEIVKSLDVAHELAETVDQRQKAFEKECRELLKKMAKNDSKMANYKVQTTKPITRRSR